MIQESSSVCFWFIYLLQRQTFFYLNQSFRDVCSSQMSRLNWNRSQKLFAQCHEIKRNDRDEDEAKRKRRKLWTCFVDWHESSFSWSEHEFTFNTFKDLHSFSLVLRLWKVFFVAQKTKSERDLMINWRLKKSKIERNL